MDRIHLVQNRKEWRAFVGSVMNLKVSLKCKQLHDYTSNYQVLHSAPFNVPALDHTYSYLGTVNEGQVQLHCCLSSPIPQLTKCYQEAVTSYSTQDNSVSNAKNICLSCSRSAVAVSLSVCRLASMEIISNCCYCYSQNSSK